MCPISGGWTLTRDGLVHGAHASVADFLVGRLLGDRRLISGAAIGVSMLGPGCARAGEEIPRIGTTGSAEIGGELPIHLSKVRPTDRALLLIGSPGAGSLSEPAGSSSWDCAIGIVSPTWVRAPIETLRPNEGVATVTLPIPDDASLVGSVFHVQWLVLEGQRGRRAKALTPTLRVVIQAASPTSRARTAQLAPVPGVKAPTRK